MLAKTGPGTPAGNAMRQYWTPALLASDLPISGGRAVRVRLLTERLVAFRTGQGQVGLLAEPCAHAGSSLAFGRVEEDGIRCSTHGWKYDLNGNCVDIPVESADGTLNQLFRQRAYPCTERSGIVWAYLGPLNEPPPLEEVEWAAAPASQLHVSRHADAQNYLESVVNHLGPAYGALLRETLLSQSPPSRGGGGSGQLAPFLALPTAEPMGAQVPVSASLWVPSDDTHTTWWSVSWHQSRGQAEP